MFYLSFKGSGKRVLLGLIVLTLLAIGFNSGLSSAAENTQPIAQGIQISPLIIPLNAEKGKPYTLKITVTNITTGDLLLKGDIVDFKAKDETGAPDLLIDNSKGDNYSFSFRKWVKPIGDIYLKSKESRKVSVSVNIPPNAEAGGHYGVIRFSGTPPELANQKVAIIASAGVLVLTRVDGNITEQLSIKEMFITHNKNRGSFFENGPLTIVSRLENTGNVHVKPSGDVTVKNFFGGTVANMKFTNSAENVLPKSIRRFEQKLNNKWMFGRYTVSSTLGYGTTGKTLIGSTSFWVIPYKVIIISLGFILLAVWIFRSLLRRYNEKIIKRANQQNKKSK